MPVLGGVVSFYMHCTFSCPLAAHWLQVNRIPPWWQGSTEAVNIFLSSSYGIKFKWEKRADGRVVWVEGCSSNTGDRLSLHQKGFTLVLDALSLVEWNKWLIFSPPHARLVWCSQFPSLLLNSLWYALRPSDIWDTLRSLMWGGVGYKYYPRRWWLPFLKMFYHQRGLTRLEALEGGGGHGEECTMVPPKQDPTGETVPVSG